MRRPNHSGSLTASGWYCSTSLSPSAVTMLAVSGIRRLRATPQARARLARAAVVPPASVWASSRTGTAGHCARQQLRRPACVARGDFLEIGHFATFSQFLHIKGRNFLDVFMFTSAYNPYKPWKVSWKSVRTFLRNPEDRHTDEHGNFIYRFTYRNFSLLYFPCSLAPRFFLRRYKVCSVP